MTSVDIDTNTHFFLTDRRLLITDVTEKPLELSTNIGFPQVAEGASISFLLGAPLRWVSPRS